MRPARRPHSIRNSVRSPVDERDKPLPYLFKPHRFQAFLAGRISGNNAQERF